MPFARPRHVRSRRLQLSVLRPGGRREDQRGAALLVLLLILLVAAGAWLLDRAPPPDRIEHQRITTAALLRAKDALLGYAASNSSLPGALPCPNADVSTPFLDGAATTSGSNCLSYIGRVPWKTLAISDVRDADGECLWYALSPIYRNTALARSVAGGTALNISTIGSITLLNTSGAAPIGVTNPVVAVIFAPGPALGPQDRTPTSGTGGSCGGNVVPSNYLDLGPPPLNINNATGNVIGSSYTFVQADQTSRFNDRMIAITSAELWNVVSRQVAAQIRGPRDESAAGLRGYLAAHGSLPFAATNPGDGVATAGLLTGAVPWDSLQPPAFPSALTSNASNGWYSNIVYSVNPGLTSATLTIGGQTFTYPPFPSAP